MPAPAGEGPRGSTALLRPCRGPRPDREITMDFVSIRIITGDVARLADFYERATGAQGVLIQTRTSPNPGPAAPPSRSADPHRPAVRARRRPSGRQQHRDHRVPRRRRGRRAPEPGRLRRGLRQRARRDALGNRSLLFRDPDGNLVNSVTPAASRSSLADDSAAARRAPPGREPRDPSDLGAPGERDGRGQRLAGNVTDRITPGLLHRVFPQAGLHPIAGDRGAAARNPSRPRFLRSWR
jgi:catechol 2,3-dioxygenase-like lactoylglutathione lyase family enzyme